MKKHPAIANIPKIFQKGLLSIASFVIGGELNSDSVMSLSTLGTTTVVNTRKDPVMKIVEAVATTFSSLV
ncbi:MAG: hypothetical protein GY941_07405 [Planctomycetes bacterium]|nr:hypothetical protein [Planctomycetota bacterium]